MNGVPNPSVKNGVNAHRYPLGSGSGGGNNGYAGGGGGGIWYGARQAGGTGRDPGGYGCREPDGYGPARNC
ncbi:hypothetical protein GCM10009678_04630 [Actinomadura kijaniata]